MRRRGGGRWARAVLGAMSRRTEIPLRGAFRLPGLAGPVHVAFDDHAVPHVRAGGDADALAAQGFCHGIHRFFQMDLLRRVLSGRLAAVVGERPLGRMSLPPFGREGTTTDADRLIRALDLVPAARRYVQQGDPEGQALVAAYVRGVNAAVRLLRRRPPLEHRLLRLPVEPWRTVDTVLIAKGMALGLSFKWRTAPLYGAIAERLADRPSLLGELLPRVPRAGDAALAGVVRRGIDRALLFHPYRTVAAGSNAFVVGGGLTRSGLPLLASDPHLELALPGVWYLVSLAGSRYRAVGASVPGLPGVVIGRTSHVAWALTNGMIDDGDVWAEEVDGAGDRYRVDGRWRALQVETQSIARRGRAPLLVRLRRTHRGPLLTDAVPAYAGPPLSLRLTLHEPSRDMEAFLALGRATRAGDALQDFEAFGSPCQNLLYADVHGTVGYRLIGKVPVRAPHPVHPALPREGTTSATDWTGFLASRDLPAFEIGPEERIVSANHPQVDGRYPHYLSHLYEPDYRAERIHELLEGRRALTPADFAVVQRDAFDRAALWFRARVLEPHAEEVRRRRPALGPLLDRLLSWDGTEEARTIGPALWHLTYHHLLRRAFGRALGESLLDAWLGLINHPDGALARAFAADDHPWAPAHVRATLLLDALEDARADLARRGLEPDAPWGRFHVLTLRHPLGRLPLLGPAFDRGPIPLRGGPYCVVSGQYFHHRPGPVVTGPSYRQVVDLGDLEGASRMVTFGGQSGYVGSRHYDDQTALWLEGEGLPMRLDREPGRGELLRLLPA